MPTLAMRAEATAGTAHRLTQRARDRILSLDERRVAAAGVLATWALALGVALTVRHASWIYYQGGDQLWYYSTAWLFAHGHSAYPLVGYLWSVLLTPIAAIAGPNVASAYPAIILLDFLVLLPVAVLALFGIARLIGGRGFAYWTLALWIAVPLIGIRFTNAGYHQRYTELTLPQGFGLTAMADFPAMVAVLVAAYFCARTLFLDEPSWTDAAAAGVAAGAAIAIKPSAALFLAGPALAYLVSRRARPALVFLAAMTPALITLALWKYRGFGYLPLLHQAAGVRVAASATLALPKYTHFNWAHFTRELSLLREHFWSGRLIEWFMIAGVIAATLRSRVLGAFLGGWFLAFAVVKGGASQASIEDASLLRILIPAYPAFILLLASLPYLLPGVRRSLPHAAAPRRPSRRLALVGIGAGLAISAVAPAALIAASPPVKGSSVAVIEQPPVPTGVDVGLTVRPARRALALSWRPQHAAGGPLFYHVYRAPAGSSAFTCDATKPAVLCTVSATDLGTTTTPSFVDRTAGKRLWAYRVGVAANWLNDPGYGDVYVLSRPVVAAGR